MKVLFFQKLSKLYESEQFTKVEYSTSLSTEAKANSKLFFPTSYQDSHSQGWSTNISCEGWVGLRLDMVCVALMVSVAASAFYAQLDAGKQNFVTIGRGIIKYASIFL